VNELHQNNKQAAVTNHWQNSYISNLTI